MRPKRGPGRPRVDPARRFWQKVDTTGDCWNWTAQLNKDGYGRFWDGTRKVLAHRFAWEERNGEVPSGMQIDHKCINPKCVNPEHLRVVTQSQNMQNLRGAQRRNRTGVRGVHWCRHKQRYVAHVTLNNKVHFVGQFADLEEAARRVKQVRLTLHTHNELDRISQ